MGPFGFNYRDAPRGIDDQPMYLTKENLTEIGGPSEYKKAEVMEQLQKIFSQNQVNKRTFNVHRTIFKCVAES